MKILYNIKMFALVIAIVATMFNTTADAENLEDFTPPWVIDHVYAKVAIVDKIDEENDMVYFLINYGEDGHYYVMEGIEDLFVGDICGLLMHDNGTSYILDDSILSVTYSGWDVEDHIIAA